MTTAVPNALLRLVGRRTSRAEIELAWNEVIAKRGKGRPVGTARFEEIDHVLIGLANQYFFGRPGISVKAAIHDTVEERWRLIKQMGGDPHASLGTSLASISARVFARLRTDISWYVEAYPFARHIKTRVKKIRT